MSQLKRKQRPYLAQPGWIAMPGGQDAPHLLGGSTWRIMTGAGPLPAPSLLLSLDLRCIPLPLLSMGASHLPLATHLNCDPGSQLQEYQFDEQWRRINWLAGWCAEDQVLAPDDRLPEPLPERRVTLRPMRPDEIPDTEEHYWSACSSFIGGDGFLRILGAPVWLQEPIEMSCSCGQPMQYVASLGYEAYDGPSLFLEGAQVLFVGEMAYYFFCCWSCRRVRVASQPT